MGIVLTDQVSRSCVLSDLSTSIFCLGKRMRLLGNFSTYSRPYLFLLHARTFVHRMAASVIVRVGMAALCTNECSYVYVYVPLLSFTTPEHAMFSHSACTRTSLGLPVDRGEEKCGQVGHGAVLLHGPNHDLFYERIIFFDDAVTPAKICNMWKSRLSHARQGRISEGYAVLRMDSFHFPLLDAIWIR